MRLVFPLVVRLSNGSKHIIRTKHTLGYFQRVWPVFYKLFLHLCGFGFLQILLLEFAHYDYKSRGTISAKDFALSMVASADMKHINKFLDHVDQIKGEPNLKDIRITFDDFKKFAELRTQLRPLSLAIFSYGKVNGLLTKKDFQRAAKQVNLGRGPPIFMFIGAY